MATSLSLENDSSLAQGYLKVNGSTAATLTTSGITGNLVGNVTGNVTGSLTQGGSLTLATAQTASGTSVDFTGIPSWAKRITVMFGSVSLNGNSSYLIQIGSGSITSSGYSGLSNGNSSVGVTSVSSANGFPIYAQSQPLLFGGHMILNLISSNFWSSFHCVGFGVSNLVSVGGGSSPNLSGTLDRIRITTVNGTDTFDAGTINISYEG
jgi:hypothetical protein